MKVGKVVRPNRKRQIVLPREECEILGIGAGVPLNIVREGNKLTISPIVDVITDQRVPMSDEEYEEVLKRTQGAWTNDDWPETERKRRKIELAASRKRKQEW